MPPITLDLAETETAEDIRSLIELVPE